MHPFRVVVGKADVPCRVWGQARNCSHAHTAYNKGQGQREARGLHLANRESWASSAEGFRQLSGVAPGTVCFRQVGIDGLRAQHILIVVQARPLDGKRVLLGQLLVVGEAVGKRDVFASDDERVLAGDIRLSLAAF